MKNKSAIITLITGLLMLSALNAYADGWNGKKVKIKSLSSNGYLAAGGDGDWIYANHNEEDATVWLIEKGKDGEYSFKKDGTSLYLNYRTSTGATKLYNGNTDAFFSITGGNGSYQLLNIEHNQFMWMADTNNNPYVAGGAPTSDSKDAKKKYFALEIVK